MSFSRWWTETVAALGDRLPLSLVALVLILAAVLVGLGWYHYPAWVPRQLPRWRLSRWRRQRRTRPTPEPTPEPAAVDDPELPDVPAERLVALADRLAAEGRYAEAARERFRGMIRELVDRGVLEHRPGLTVTELAAAAARNRPEVDPPLSEAGRVFSDLWYAQRPARPEHDERMRALATELGRTLTDGVPANDDGMARK
ncbi:DUF4129 domain-containing protein [Plantactinospora endophytica]|uniref:Protein-glutamine gamma-glutamyltransferase-like C-terminal domain-containing protein n=1 Tax=Plantactinospora endophytica TaxID=673535 RepID=A0ABQ4DVE1_9ACTN|nr:DUF4129 domain-containing protein [Plantactinospora endophytica]GIG86072.1 hypothetical protein Pen02_10080 [Plantactinospora endophytica]